MPREGHRQVQGRCPTAGRLGELTPPATAALSPLALAPQLSPEPEVAQLSETPPHGHVSPVPLQGVNPGWRASPKVTPWTSGCEPN